MQGPELSLLSHWQNFYMLVGTASATLTGLMFVATTILAGIDTHVPTANAGIAAFNTPTVVQFGAVLLLAGILSAPWQTFSSISILICLFSAGMVFYLFIIMRRMRRMPHYQSTREDWLWYMALPLLANVLLIVAALVLPKNPSPALYIISLAMMLLLLVGIRNAWDNVTFLAVERAHSESKTRK
jgi:ABC-type microcin C transport system permease subunit YejB